MSTRPIFIIPSTIRRCRRACGLSAEFGGESGRTTSLAVRRERSLRCQKIAEARILGNLKLFEFAFTWAASPGELWSIQNGQKSHEPKSFPDGQGGLGASFDAQDRNSMAATMADDVVRFLGEQKANEAELSTLAEKRIQEEAAEEERRTHPTDQALSVPLVNVPFRAAKDAPLSSFYGSQNLIWTNFKRCLSFDCLFKLIKVKNA